MDTKHLFDDFNKHVDSLDDDTIRHGIAEAVLHTDESCSDENEDIFGSIYSIKNFVNLIKSGYITDYDGFGEFTNGSHRKDLTGVYVKCDVNWIKKNCGSYKYVAWYNK